MSAALRIVCPHCDSVNELPATQLGQQPYCGRCSGKLFNGRVIDLNAQNFDVQITASDIPVVVKIWAPESEACRTLSPVYARAAVALEPDFRLTRLNLQDAPLIARRLDVQQVPTLLVFRNGREVGRRSGALPLLELMGWIGDQCRAEPAALTSARPNPALRL